MRKKMLAKAEATLKRPIWEGGRTLELGELLVFIIACLLVWRQGKLPLGKWSTVVALAILFLAFLIF